MGRSAVAEKVMTSMRGGTATYGLDLLHDTGLTSGTLYPALVRLVRARLVEAQWQGNGRRCYVLTPAGVAAIECVALDPVAARARISAWWLSATMVAAIASLMALALHSLPDLAVYVGAIRGLQHGDSLYAFMSVDHAPFTYPPFAALILWPLANVPTFPLRLGWTLATVAIVIALSIPLAKAVPRPRRWLAPAISAALLLSAPVSSNLRYGQVSVALAALVVADIVGLRASRFHGMGVGLAAAVKLTPLVFIPMLWFAGRRTAAMVAASTFAACGAFAWTVLPDDSWRFWDKYMWHVSRLGNIASNGNQSINGALVRLGIDGLTRSLVALVVAGAVAAVALRRGVGLGLSGDWLSATIVVGAASVVVSPVSWTHHQLWLVMAAVLPLRASGLARLAWGAAVLGITVLPVTALGGPVWGNARLLTAICVACVVPLRTNSQSRTSRQDGPGAPDDRISDKRMPAQFGCSTS